MSQLRVPKRRVPVVAGLPGGPVAGEVFLSDFARTHAGPERIHDLLEGEERFFPLVADGAVRLVARDALRWLRVSPEAAEEAVSAGEPSEYTVDITFQDGARLAGTVRFDAPSGRTRLADYLNEPGRFFPVVDGEGFVFVRREHIAQISFSEVRP